MYKFYQITVFLITKYNNPDRRGAGKGCFYNDSIEIMNNYYAL